MERTQKEVVVGSIKEKFDRMTSAVFLDFKGLDVATVSKLRDEFRKLRQEGVESGKAAQVARKATRERSRH